MLLTVNTNEIAMPWQDYTKILSNLLNGSISLHPIVSAIQELELAAKKTEVEAKVRDIFKDYHSSQTTRYSS